MIWSGCTDKDMESENIQKEKRIRMEVRQFFMDCLTTLYAQEGVGESERNARRQKEVVVKHYEEISARFFDEMFYRLAKINWELPALIEEVKKLGDNPSPLDMMRLACGDEQRHQAMIDEYRLCMTLLLEGADITH